MVRETISRATNLVVAGDLTLQDALARGYVNVSAASRLILPNIERIVGRRAKLQSVITALKRARNSLSTSGGDVRAILAQSVVNVRTDVAKVAAEKTKRVLEATRRLLASYQEEFLQVSESISTVTLLFDQRLIGRVESQLGGSEILESVNDLAAIIVNSPKEIVHTPGCIAVFLGQLARRLINVQDVVSCYTDTIIVVDMNDAPKAFSALADLITEFRRKLNTPLQTRI